MARRDERHFLVTVAAAAGNFGPALALYASPYATAILIEIITLTPMAAYLRPLPGHTFAFDRRQASLLSIVMPGARWLASCEPSLPSATAALIYREI